jgi:hypothetical protein
MPPSLFTPIDILWESSTLPLKKKMHINNIIDLSFIFLTLTRPDYFYAVRVATGLCMFIILHKILPLNTILIMQKTSNNLFFEVCTSFCSILPQIFSVQPIPGVKKNSKECYLRLNYNSNP